MMRWAVPLAALGLVFVVAGGGDRPELTGTWKAVAAVLNGKGFKKDDKERYLVLDGRVVRVKENDRVVASGTFETDLSRSPHALDVTLTEGPRAVKGLTLYGIYEIKGNTLKLCFTTLGADERPKTFASAEDSGFLFLTLVRESRASKQSPRD